MSGHSFVESSIQTLTHGLSRALVSERISKEPGLLQSLDPRVRLVGLLSLVVAVTLCRKISVLVAVFILATILALVSAISMKTLVTRVWLVVLAFTGFIALPAVFVTPGDSIVRIGFLSITQQGVWSALLLVLRVGAAVTLTTALVLCTPWTHLLKALRSLRVPAEVIVMLAMTHRYIFLFIETANQMFESRQSRMVGVLSGREQRALAARTGGVLLGKTIELSNEVYLAMQSRGFRGEVRLLEDRRLCAVDYAALAVSVVATAVVIWLGR